MPHRLSLRNCPSRLAPLLLGILAIGSCGRLGFDPSSSATDARDIPTPLLTGFSATAAADGPEGSVLVTYDPPVGLDSVVRVDIVRVPGSSAPIDCADGQVTMSVTDLDVGRLVDQISERWHRFHSYRACLYTDDGDALTDPSMVAEAVAFRNPAPGCQQPLCDYARPSVPSSGTFERRPGLASVGATSGDIALSDVDDDGDLDVIVAAPGPNIVHHGTGDGLFEPGFELSNRGLDSRAAVTGDFNNDRLQDIVFANADGPSYLHLGTGDGIFDDGRAIYPDTFPEMFDAAAADLNGDTHLDLVFTRYDGQDLIYLGVGDGSFNLLGPVKPENNFSCVNCLQIQDVNRDRIPDLIMAYNTGDTRLDIFLGLGDGSFQKPLEVGYGTLTPISVKLADMDNDGDLDIAVGRSLGGAVYVSMGDGNGSFEDLTQLDTNTSSRCYGLATNDFDGDGNIDIIFSQDNDGVIGALYGAGDGTFAQQVDLDGNATWTTSSIDVGDVNGDGKLDFVMGVADSESQLFLGL